MSTNCELRSDIDIGKPRWDQSTICGRYLHQFFVTCPINALACDETIECAKKAIESYKKKEKLCITEEELWAKKHLVDSAYNPETGKMIPIYSRMCSQFMANVVILGGMLTYFKSTGGTVIWQGLNQSFISARSYLDDSRKEPVKDEDAGVSYGASTVSAIAAALIYNRIFRCSAPLVRRFAPLIGVSIGHMASVATTRWNEYQDGAPVYNSSGKEVGKSPNAARWGTGQTILSRVTLTGIPLFFTPYIMNHLERRGTLCRYPWSTMPFNMLCVGFFLLQSIPLSCALFGEKFEVSPDTLEENIAKNFKDGEMAFINTVL